MAFYSIEKSLGRLVKARKLKQEEAGEIIKRIKGDNELKRWCWRCRPLDRSRSGEFGTQEKIFRALDEVCQPHTILASNTSGLMITDIVSATRRPEKVIELHWFNPAPVMRLIEITRGPRHRAGPMRS